MKRLNLLSIVVMIVVSLVVLGCRPHENGDDVPIPVLMPTVVDNVSYYRVTLSSEVEDLPEYHYWIMDNGFLISTEPYPTVDNYMFKIKIGSGFGKYTNTFEQLTPDTKYYVRSYAINCSRGTGYGEQADFKTLPFGDTTVMVNGVSFKMIAVDMNFDDQELQKQGSLNNLKMGYEQSFSIAETEVTQKLWEAVMGSNPSHFKGENLPVENVSYSDCLSFIDKLNQLTGLNFRMPSFDEWEMAARGGKDDKNYRYSGSNTLGRVGWFVVNSDEQTHEVKTKNPNQLGIYDMSGNVSEWCRYDQIEITRGGSWNDSYEPCKIVNYAEVERGTANNSIGLRLAM